MAIDFARSEPPGVDYRSVLVVRSGTLGEGNAPEVEKDDSDWEKTFVVENLESGLEEALAYFGIHEC